MFGRGTFETVGVFCKIYACDSPRGRARRACVASVLSVKHACPEFAAVAFEMQEGPQNKYRRIVSAHETFVRLLERGTVSTCGELASFPIQEIDGQPESGNSPTE